MTIEKDLCSGFIPLHVLHHACEGPLYGFWIIEELGRHGYKLSPGTLYPMLHRMERRGLLRSAEKGRGRNKRREYRTTARGRRALDEARQKVSELFGELFERELRSVFGGRKHESIGKRSAMRKYK